jgi:hypothetical protein
MPLRPAITPCLALSLALCAAGAAFAAPAKVAPGNYQCWAHGAARILMNFKVIGEGRYSNEDGDEKGAFTYAAASGVVTFKGGHLDGAMPDGFKAVYQERKARPVLSFIGRSGSEAAFCELAGR